MRNSLVLRAVAATIALLMTAVVVRCQNPTTPEPAPTAPVSTAPTKPLPKPHKIWTDEDFAQKAAQAQADPSVKHGEASPVGRSSPQTNLANSLKEVEHAINDSLEDIRDQKDTLARLSKELYEIPEDQRAERIKEIERRKIVLQGSEKELTALQAKRDDLASRAAQNGVPESGVPR